MTTYLTELLKDSAYRLDQFKPEQIKKLEAAISLKDSGKKAAPYVTCVVRGKPIKLTPEEAVRQLYLLVLRDDLGYPVTRMEVEYEVTFGREKKRADICIFDKDKTTTPYILVELKKPKLKDGKEQLKSYCNATGAPMGVWTNGQQISYYHRKDPNYFEDIPAIPSAHERLSDILSERWTIDDLVKLDKLVNERKSLKDLILEMEDEVLSNAGVDVFEELFKLIFTKLFDEMESGQDRKRHLVFKNYGDTESELKTKIQVLFEKAQETWEGVFPAGAKIDLTPSHLAVCVSSLEKVKLFNSNLEVVDEAFEYLINKSSKGEKGQYFTPRYVIDMCVKMMNPQEHETLIDTASGSCGFPVHGIFHVWEQIRRNLSDPIDHLFTTQKKTGRYAKYVVDKVFAIDFDERAVRVGRTLNLIAGDGQTNVLHLNTLDYERWFEKTGDDKNPGDETWKDVYGDGWKRLRKLRASKNENRDFQFDVLMANPPFAGDIKETRILSRYDLARSVSFDKVSKIDPTDPNIIDASKRSPTFPEALHTSHETIYQMGDGTYRKVKVKNQTNVGRDILFIERNLQFLKPGGRMAVVLPQGRFNNASDKALREYLAEHGRILAVVGLHGNVFKPHTGTKTSVLFIQKWNDDPRLGAYCPKVVDYPIFFATMREPSKDNSGNKIYRSAPDGQPLLDNHGHLIVKHDLFNHDGLTEDGIAEAFAEFAKIEKLSFFAKTGSWAKLSDTKNLVHSHGYLVDSSRVYSAERIDAEHFQPKFDALMDSLHAAGDCIRLGDYLLLNQRGKQPQYADEGLPVINSKHVLRNDVRLGEDNRRAIAEKGQIQIQTGDVLINGTGVGTIGRAAVYLHSDLALPDNHVTVLRPINGLDPVYLAVFLNSTAGQLQVEQRLRGSSGQIELYPADIAEFRVWLAPKSVQKSIRNQVEQSFEQRRRAADLLNAAKHAVEIAIEDSEAAALAYLDALR